MMIREVGDTNRKMHVLWLETSTRIKSFSRAHQSATQVHFVNVCSLSLTVCICVLLTIFRPCCSVDENSIAAKNGLQVGDQVLDVNGTSFVEIMHTEAIRIMKSSPYLVMTVKVFWDVRKVHRLNGPGS